MGIYYFIVPKGKFIVKIAQNTAIYEIDGGIQPSI